MTPHTSPPAELPTEGQPSRETPVDAEMVQLPSIDGRGTLRGPSEDLGDIPGRDCKCLMRLQLVPGTPATPANAISQRTSSAHRNDANPVLLDLLEVFFQHEYPLPSYSFLHPATTKEKCRTGVLESCLALAIAGVAILHTSMRTNDTKHHDGNGDNISDYEGDLASCYCRGQTSVRAADQIIWSYIESPTVARLQALLLSINYCMHTGQFQRAFMLAALASRFAAAMRLNHEKPDLDFVARETRRRIVWSLKLIERYFSIGLPEFELCPFESIYVKLPCSEEDFVHGSRQASPSMNNYASQTTDSDYGAYNLCVNLESFRRDIMKFSRRIALCDSALPQFPSMIRSFEQSLSSIGTKMPHGPELSFIQISTLLDSRWLPRHVALQLSWHQCHCDLYRLLLPGYQEAAPKPVLASFLYQGDANQEQIMDDLVFEAERLCLHHASAIISLLTSLNQLSTRPHLLEFDATICAYHATRLLLFISRFGKDRKNRPTAEFAASRVDLCVAALRRFFPRSKLVSPILSEMERSMGKWGLSSSSAVVVEPQRERVDVVNDELTRMPSPGRPGRPGRRESSTELHRVLPGEVATQRLAVHSLLRQAEFADEPDRFAADRLALPPRPSTTAITEPVDIIETQQPTGANQPPINLTTGSQTQSRPEIAALSPAWAPQFVQDSEANPLAGIQYSNHESTGMSEEWEFNSFMPMQAWDMQMPFCSWLGSEDQDLFSG
ncbi:hypothetical protein N7474_009911 [Penicillium riverlandense]|uniref:uncharacterized protein n=1 Tax=Penicillium riverlandense TaxID=1903569 RepID=UPI002546C1DE|nr:uncharacterized protein N7474_009911 [Penicillium riverlandense]KAJ5808642.1 hypothetical protein N7474_009911 [Penicillium riverlandense]